MTERAARDIVRRHLEEMWNGGDLSVARELCAPDLVQHDPFATRLTDLEAYLAYLSEVRRAFPDLVLALEDTVAEDDRVVVRWSFRGTHLAEMRGLPATGRRIVFAGMSMYRLQDGRIAEIWTSFDTGGYLRQIDALPGTAAGA
jgi:steroid delta-isomerase-like uncharacterized protein